MSGEVSSVSNETANVRFFNATRQNVEVVWVNFSGRRQRYATLPEGASVDINTYVNHVWVFHETVTDIQYLANGQLHFRVKPTQHPCPAFRQMVRITHPLFSLRQIACISVRSQLPLFLAKRPRIPVPYKPYEDENNEEVNIIFKNMTEGDVSLIWLAPGGYQVLYRLIGRKHLTLYSKTVVGHMWVAESPDNGARLLVGGKTAYAAEKSADQEQTPLIEIRAPVYSLAELAGMRVRQDVYLSKTPVKLDLPVTVLRELDRETDYSNVKSTTESFHRSLTWIAISRLIQEREVLNVDLL